MNNLKPLEFGDIFNYTFRILRRRFLHIYIAMGWIYLPIALLYSYYYNKTLGWSFAGALGQTGSDVGFDILLQTYALLGIYTLVQQILRPLTAAGVVKVVTMTLRGEETSPGDIFRSIFENWNWLKLLALGAVITVTLFMGALALLLPALFFSVTFSLVTQVLMVEGGSVWRALSRSWSMVLKDLGRVALVFLLMGLLTYFAASVVTTPITLGMGLLIAFEVENIIWFMALSLLSGFLGLLIAPVPIIALTLLYHDLRARREGIDLERRIDILS
ncbi:MAG: hypothetical protein GX878_08800 [Firmicutes bacterium]|nr:hypothetical protein [Bacillota bacterium]